MQTFTLTELPCLQVCKGNFDRSCSIDLSDEAIQAMEAGQLRLTLRQIGKRKKISNLSIVLKSTSGNIKLSVGDSGSSIYFENGSRGTYDIKLWRESQVFIGEGTTSNGVNVICDNSSFKTGKDCMLSSNILIQTSDQHGIVDLSTGEIINDKSSQVMLGDHVWLCRQSTIMADVSIEDGSVVGACALVTRSVPKMTIVAGVPAKVVRQDVTWCRSPTQLDTYAEEYVSDFALST